MNLDDRIELLNQYEPLGNILYLMNRDQRLQQNYCTQLGYTLSNQNSSQFSILYSFGEEYVDNAVQTHFIVQGLKKLEKECDELNINFFTSLESKTIENYLSSFTKSNNIKTIIIDFSMLRHIKERDEKLLKFCNQNSILLIRVDAHNIVPARILSTYKRTAYSVRLLLDKQCDRFLEILPTLEKHTYNNALKRINKYPTTVESQKLYFGGTDEGIKMFKIFIENKLNSYAKNRNIPSIRGTSDLSPWLHTGQISAQYLVCELTNRHSRKNKNIESFVNEIFIWRETAEHFVLHEPNYDNIDGALDWAKETLLSHKNDARKDVYSSIEDFAGAKTDDDLWNACQNQLLVEGKMHGYCRMYWAKKLLEWTRDPRDAIRIAIELNDKYSIDGNDPNGYLGVMWSICGNMDRGFKERDVIGKIRPMKKFKADEYIKKYKTVYK